MSRRLTVLARAPGIVLHACHSGRLWASRGHEVLVRDAAAPGLHGWIRYAQVPTEMWRTLAGRSNWLGPALRLGIHGVVPLASGAVLVSVSGRLLRIESGGPEIAMHYEDFRKPTHHGIVALADGTVLVGEYRLGRGGHVRVWASHDDGRNFAEIHRFPPGEVRHVHFLQQDPVDGALWMGTGDLGDECGLYRSGDGARSWQVIGRGGQQWRAMGLAFGPDAIWYGTDAGRDAGDWQNRALRLERGTWRLDEFARLQGPVHGVAATPDGAVLLATGVEGGRNEVDRRVHLWLARPGAGLREIAHWSKGLQPRLAQFAVARFAEGQATCPRTFVVLRGTMAMQLGTLEVALPA